jgi:hypothetical protein
MRRLLCFTSAALLVACSSKDVPPVEEKPGMLGRAWESTVNATRKLNPLADDLKPRPMKERQPIDFKKLTTEVLIDPPAPKLSEQRQITVTVRLHNKGKRVAPLAFPTTQRVDVLVKTKDGKVVEHWADDHRFENEPGLVAINPGERLEYNLNVATRELTAGVEFTVEGFFPAYETLRATGKVTPVP